VVAVRVYPDADERGVHPYCAVDRSLEHRAESLADPVGDVEFVLEYGSYDHDGAADAFCAVQLIRPVKWVSPASLVGLG
jgi:hypothetical protein